MSGARLPNAGEIFPGTEEAVSREAQVAAGLAAFFAITAEWGLDADQQRRLLGNPGRTRFFALKRHHRGQLSDDELDRLSYIAGIYAALNVLYNRDNQLRWLTNPGRHDGPWGHQSPLDYMLTGKLVALADVRRHLDAIRGGL